MVYWRCSDNLLSLTCTAILSFISSSFEAPYSQCSARLWTAVMKTSAVSSHSCNFLLNLPFSYIILCLPINQGSNASFTGGNLSFPHQWGVTNVTNHLQPGQRPVLGHLTGILLTFLLNHLEFFKSLDPVNPAIWVSTIEYSGAVFWTMGSIVAIFFEALAASVPLSLLLSLVCYGDRSCPYFLTL